MKLAIASTFLLCSAVGFEDEASLIASRKGEARQSLLLTSDAAACPLRPLDARWLVNRYTMNISDPVHLSALASAVNSQLLLGSTTQFIQESSDASRTGDFVIDGLSGATAWPAGGFKPLLTVGEINMCEENHGEVYVGVPDGMGAYLHDDTTVRIVVQSESYGPVGRTPDSYPYWVNGGSASFTGSHVQYAEFEREALSVFMSNTLPASTMIKAFGQIAFTYYNLNGVEVGPRRPTGGADAHFSNTDENGIWALPGAPEQADWLMQSLCSAHLEEAHQWGEGIGLEDDIYITNEEWINYEDGAPFVGISAHFIDLQNGVDYAVGSTTQTGFEKIAEINPMHPDYVVLAVSGYNGAYNGNSGELNARNSEYGPRAAGTPNEKPYVWTRDICPARIYVGVKGLMEDGSPAPADDFLARNGMRYGKIYGYAIDMSPQGPSGGLWRDAYHKPRANGESVEGKWIPIDWQWDGTARNYRHDGGWQFQLNITHVDGLPSSYAWWNAKGLDEPGSKTEHLSPDLREGYSAFIQSSTAGYFGHYYVENLLDTLNAANGDLPDMIDGNYFVYQGESDITSQIMLGGQGLTNIVAECPGVTDATLNCDNPESVKSTFEDIDGLEVIAAAEGLYIIIQEDSGNELGERMFIGALEHEADGQELTYMFMAQSGGKFNTRMRDFVGIPAGTNDGGNSHEFSGIVDLSGMLLKDASGNFVAPAGNGAAKRAAEHMTPINDKIIAINLQAHNLDAGVIKAFRADRGGQILAYQPNI